MFIISIILLIYKDNITIEDQKDLLVQGAQVQSIQYTNTLKLQLK